MAPCHLNPVRPSCTMHRQSSKAPRHIASPTAPSYCLDLIWTWSVWTPVPDELHSPYVFTFQIVDVSQRLAQSFNGDALLELIKRLVLLDQHWIPTEPGHSLYIRPTMSLSNNLCWVDLVLTCLPVGTQHVIGVSPPTDALLFVICCPVGPYYSHGFKPVSLHATAEYIRAAPGGMFSYSICIREF